MRTKIIFQIVLIVLISLSNLSFAQRIAAGGWHSLVVCNDSTIKTFGENATGELGNGSDVDSSNPIDPGLSGIIEVSGGGDQLEAHSLALKSDGTVWSWGSNIYGALGNGSTNNTSVPGPVLVLSDIVSISAGGWHSVALKRNGTVWTWGWNTDGQLGDGTTSDRTIANQVPGLSGITAISAGTYHVLALKDDSTVWAWGDNVSGQIGDGTTIDKTSPVQVSGLTGIVKVSAGRFFSLAVKNDGTVWTWGENIYGQLGNGTTTESHVPVQVNGLTGITSAIVATGAFHCMTVKNDGTVWAWGRNTYGNLGDGSVAHRSIPVQMQGIADVAGMAAGTNFSLIYKTDGTFWGCGRNLSGQLGDGTLLQRNTLSQSTNVCSILQISGIAKYGELHSKSITAFPNPSANGVFSIDLSDVLDSKSEEQIAVYDVLGNIILQKIIDFADTNEPVEIDISSKPNGIYYLTISSDSSRIYQKLIKQ
ncbi:MAG: T9SS type A sorting domain-containing protein [Bacteroidota bacterium]